MANLIGFDLEGPLSPQYNAYELMKLFPDGDRVLEVISRYGELLTLEGRADYEAGDMMALIVPFLILHNITEADITNLAVKATFTEGALELTSRIEASSWKIFCITTTYEPYAIHLINKLGIYTHNLASTTLPVDKLHLVSKKDGELLQKIEDEILKMRPAVDDDRIKQSLDDFFRKKLPTTDIGAVIREIKPMGGQRKVTALNKFTDTHSQPLSRWVVVGDSITDAKMLGAVEEAGGLAIAFNADTSALLHATIGLASTSIGDLMEVLNTWTKGQRKAVEKLIKDKEKVGGKGDRGYFHWLSGRKNLDDVVKLHQRIRQVVRGEAV